MPQTEPVNLYRSRSFQLLVCANFFASVVVGICQVLVPWYIINSPGGDAFFGTVAFFTNLVIMVISPVCGVYIDRMSRKSAMLWLRVVLFISIVINLNVMDTGNTSTLTLSLFFLIGHLFLIINNVARLALVQEVFASNNYGKVNSFMEVEKQAATVFTGAITVVLLKDIGVQTVIFICLGTVALSTLSLYLIDYRRPAPKTARTASFLSDFTEGFGYLANRPALAAFLIASFAPYICVLVGNYLIPLILASYLKVGVENFALYEILFGAGSIACGVSIYRILNKFGNITVILVCMLIFAGTILSQAIWPTVVTIVWLGLLTGFTNSAVRITRFSWMMHIVDNAIIGRVNTAVSSLVLAAKTALTGIVAYVAVAAGPVKGLWVMFAFMLLATAIAASCVKSLPVPKPVPAE